MVAATSKRNFVDDALPDGEIRDGRHHMQVRVYTRTLI